LEVHPLTTDRYSVIYDGSDFILDNETGEYYCIEEACNKLNDLNERLKLDDSSFETIVMKIQLEEYRKRYK
jgi:hypothetical protein